VRTSLFNYEQMKTGTFWVVHVYLLLVVWELEWRSLGIPRALTIGTSVLYTWEVHSAIKLSELN
jgi:hypothetical protein